MKKKYLAPVVMALIVVISTAAISCGKQADKEANATEPETTAETSTEALETTAPAETETSETTASVKESDNTTTTEAPETTPAETEKTPVKQTEAAKKETSAPKTEITKNTTPASTPTKAQTSPTQAPPAPTTPAAPAHVHVWIDHTATRQEWVPNIVSVPDYEVQRVCVGSNTICNCGVVNPSQDHLDNHILNGEPGNYWYDYIYEDQMVQVGSHDEDQGYYKDVEYVDYQYCDCGATKP